MYLKIDSDEYQIPWVFRFIIKVIDFAMLIFLDMIIEFIISR